MIRLLEFSMGRLCKHICFLHLPYELDYLDLMVIGDDNEFDDFTEQHDVRSVCYGLKNLDLYDCRYIIAMKSNASRTLKLYGSSLHKAGLAGLCQNVNSIVANSLLVADEYVFAHLYALSNIAISSCKSLEQHAFDSCESLTRVVLPCVTRIGESAFDWCSKLEYLDTGKVERLDSKAFDMCTGLHCLLFPEVKEVERNAFLNCSSLRVLLLGRVQRWQHFGTFRSLEELYLPRLLSESADDIFLSEDNMGLPTFSGNDGKLKKVVLPASIEGQLSDGFKQECSNRGIELVFEPTSVKQ